MLFHWLNEKLTPGFNKRDRMMAIIRSLSITNRDQLITITGWTEMEVDGAIKRIRKLGSTKAEKDQWLRVWRPLHRGYYAYALGEKGLRYVREMMNDVTPYDVYSPWGQARHFIGTNEILCRVIRSGYKVDTWLSQKEVMSYLYYQLMPEKSPVNPDALIRVNGSQEMFLEFDTGTEAGGKIENRMHRYLKLACMVGRIFPVVWVTISETRKSFLSRKWQESLLTFEKKQQKKLPVEVPEMFFFVEGQEVRFLAGGEKAEYKAI